VGRLTSFLANIDRLDNTIIVVISDNGASQEGGLEGTLNEFSSLSQIPENLAANLQRIDDIGTDKSFTNYPLGWAMAGNTPFPYYKQTVHGGGTNDPLIIHWPKGIKDKGPVRKQLSM
jgi:arylsulfatase A-like enzyme